MTHKFKVGDRVRLEGVVVDGETSCFQGVRLDGDDDLKHNMVHRKAMAHATLIPPERPELKSGQVWEDASGNGVRIEGLKMWTEKDDKFMLQGFIEGSIESRRNYNTDGVRYCEDATGPSYLVKLIEDVAAEVQQEPKAPPPLDASKPIRITRTGEVVRYVGRMSDGRIVGEYSFNGALQIMDYYESELENIPTPKRTASRDVVMISGYPELVYDSSPAGNTGNVLARGTIMLTEGDGMDVVQP